MDDMKGIASDKSLGFTMHQMRKLIKKEVVHHMKERKGGNNIAILFDTDLEIGNGFFKPRSDMDHELVLGTYPYSKDDESVMTNEEAIKLYGTVLHELVHYDQYESHSLSKEDAICEASKHGNICYYLNVWSNMPHEIEAEFKSTMLMMDKMKEMRPAIVDEKNHVTEGEAMMLERLTDRARNGGYILDPPKEPFSSRTQVRFLFRMAERYSPDKKKSLPKVFFRAEDEIAQMLTDEHRNIRPEYEPIYHQLTHEESGRKMDQMMASLVFYLHPELYDTYPQIDPKEMEPRIVFGMDIPETREQLWERITPCNNKDIFRSQEGKDIKKMPEYMEDKNIYQDEDYDEIGRSMSQALDEIERRQSEVQYLR